MIHKRKSSNKILIIIIVFIFLVGIVISIINNNGDKKIDAFNNKIEKYSLELNKIAYGDYEKEYNKLIEKVNKVNRTKKLDNINKIEDEFNELTNKIKSVLEADITNKYTELQKLNINKLSEEDKNEVVKVRNQIGKLINKGYYRVAYNEMEILTKKINSKNEEAVKKEEEEKKKQEELNKNKEKEEKKATESNKGISTEKTNNEDENENRFNDYNQNNN